MLPAPFSVTYDHAQTRTQEPSIFLTVRASEMFTFSDTWLDPITKSLMLKPMHEYNAWFTSNAGIYAKPVKASYDFGTAANWEEVEVYVGAGKFLRNATASDYARTATAPGLNRGVVLTFVNYGAGEQGDLCTFGWDDTDTTTAATLHFTLSQGGELVVRKNGSIVKETKIAIPPSNNFVELFIMPMRTREILVWCRNTARGAVIVFDDIAEGTASPTITPAEKFWWKASSSATVSQVQIVPVKFNSSGYANSEIVTMPRAPRTGATLRTTTNPVFTGVTNASVYGVKAGAGTTDVSSVAIYETDGTTAFMPNGVKIQSRVRATLSGDGNYTPFVYAVSTDYPGTTGTTNATESATPDTKLLSLSVNVPDDAFGTTLSAVYKEPDSLATDVKKLRTVRNRPVKLEVDSLVLLDGWTRPTRFTDSLEDCAKRAVIDSRDMTAALDVLMFRDEIPFDGYDLSKPATGSNYSVVEFLLSEAGLSRSQMDLSDASFVLPEVPGKESGEWGFSIRPGDTARSVLEQLHQEFAADWFMGVRPSATGPKFAFLSPAGMPATAAIKVYRSQADAVADGVTAADAWKQTMQTYEDAPEEVDANIIFATGVDPRTEEIVQSYARDDSSVDCTTVPTSRPDNWIGMEKPFGVFDHRLRTTTDTDKAVELLANVVTESRLIGEFSMPTMLWYNSDPGGTDVMLPVWRGDLVTIDGVGDVRITSMRFESIRNHADHLLTTAVYTFGGLTHAGGSDLATIQKRNNARRANSLVDLRRVNLIGNPIRSIRRNAL